MNKINKIIELLESIDAKLSEKKVQKKKRVSDFSEETPSGRIWSKYVEWYKIKYKGVEPVRNSFVNASIKTFVSRVPEENHLHLVHFFINQNDAWYLREMHHIKCLVKDCEMLLTRMKSKVVITSGKAREMERVSDNINESQRFLENKYGK